VSEVRKRSLTINGHRTSISLEAAFWDALKEIAAENDRSLAALVAEIDRSRGSGGLSSAIRVFVLARYRPVAKSDAGG
jgi:predicted DNA-binding ribbon-helix-helix protein